MAHVRLLYLLLLIVVTITTFEIVYSLSEDNVVNDSSHDDNDIDDENHIDDSDIDDQNVKYIYDYYYETDLTPNKQFRDCIDHRKFCYSLRHLCPKNNNNNHNNNNNTTTDSDENVDSFRTNQQNDEPHSDYSTRKVIRWMISHCPYTCQVCDTHQIYYNVPYEYTMKYDMETKIRLLPNHSNLYSKINPNLWVDNIRDAMTGKSINAITTSTSTTTDDDTISDTIIGIQYLMSTTTKLQNRISHEQRNAMIQHIYQTQQYYYNTVVLPMLQIHNNNNISNMVDSCRNQSPYCTYWAVVYERCQDPFYHLVMSKHCPVTCQLCHEILMTNTTTTNTKNHHHQHEKETISTDMDHDTNAATIVTTTVTKGDDAEGKDDIVSTTTSPATSTTMDDDHSEYIFDSENCIYDPTSMPDIWYPNTYSVHQMFERMVTTTITTIDNQMNMTILSQPLYNETILVSEERKDSIPSLGNDNQQQQQLSPWLIQIDDFLSDTECDYLIQLGTTLGYERSTGMEYNKKQQQSTNQKNQDLDDMDSTTTTTTPKLHTVISDERTSSTTWCHHSDCSHQDVIIQSIYHRIQNLIQIPSSHYESLQLLQYETGQYYKSHHDYIPTHRRSYFGPRILTLLMYLSDVKEGGATHFPFLNITIQPQRGRIVLWSNVLHTQPNVMDLRMIHQALPVKQGIKYASNLWIHQREMYPNSCYVTEEELDDEEVEEDEDAEDESPFDDEDS